MYEIYETLEELKKESMYREINDIEKSLILIQSKDKKDNSIKRLCDIKDYTEIPEGYKVSIKLISDISKEIIVPYEVKLVYCKETGKFYYNFYRRRMQGKDVAKLLLDFVNGCGYDNAGFMQEICNSHRTLQQCVFGLMVDCMHKWAEYKEQGYFDLRNESTVKTCAKLEEVLKDVNLPFI